MFRMIVLALLLTASFSSFAFVKIPGQDWGFSTLSYIDSPEGDFSSAPIQNKKGQLKRRIMNEFALWKGTDYRWGGDSLKGIDCSAFTRRIIASVIHKHLPRTALEQRRTGHLVSQDNLKPGDLVFFETKPNVHHVGVFIGNDKFIHASSSQGVTSSHLSNRYWQEHYVTARRVSA
ncbi:NlpC/P60 family protein [Citrobacter sp. RHB25-C09]|uniref:C40 family peptidase n=1 Tax=Citrobacter sp. RHB25-C09 TaxID=2742624 RepID=UPI002017AA06|nr:NlpC/P60 family protein [Citrobacter sp. RHB25-C09]